MFYHQFYAKKNPKKAPLEQPDLITEHYKKLVLDIVGSRERSKHGFAYLIIAMDHWGTISLGNLRL